MTCIIGLEEDGKIYIGGDSASGYPNIVRSTTTQKVFAIEPFIFGYTSSFRMGQILHYNIDFPIPPESIYNEEYMVGIFIEIVRKQFKEYGFSKIETNEESGGTFLVGVAGQIWQVESDFQVSRPKDGIFAIGSGSDVALGAMKALEHKLEPRERILDALAICAYFCPYVRPPFVVLER